MENLSPHAAAHAADRAIAWYQYRLSPRKGWSCAHAAAHGGESCSAAIRSIVAAHGVLRGAAPTFLRFAACARAAQFLAASSGPNPGASVQGVCCCGPIPIPFRF